ncbi:MAG TPA: hypothetical protein VGO07_06440, partial [Candidatus Saccharimonadales bacterium]|nr:hypothetical protein [Candidatus Saccharimonadales bacterium]
MTEYIPRHATTDVAVIPPSPLVEFGLSYNDITDPTVLFQYDRLIGQYEHLQAAQTIELPDQTIVAGNDWNEQP